MYRLTALVLIVALMLIGCSQDVNQTTPTAPAETLSYAPMARYVSSANLISATLQLNVYWASGLSIDVHRATAAWDEATVTYGNYGEAYDPSVEDSFLADAVGWRTADVTDLVAAYLDGSYENFGFLLRNSEFNFPVTAFNSSEAYSNQPVLELCYGDPNDPECMQIGADHDSYIWENYPTGNFGNAEVITTGWKDDVYPQKLALIHFPLPTPPELASIGDFVWYDTNNDGLQDVNEAGLAGVTVNLYNCENMLIASMNTNINGYYLFTDLEQGDYYVEFEAPADYLFSPMDQGANDALDSDVDPMTGRTSCSALDAGETDLTWDAGLYLPVNEDCDDCDGKMTELTFAYLGSTEAMIEVLSKGKKRTPAEVLFSGQVLPGGSFSVVGFDKHGTLGTEITIIVDGTVNTKIHTSCSRPIYIGMISGDFEILDGYSRFGGQLCIGEGGGDEEPSDCDGKITELTLAYTGDAVALIEVFAKGKKGRRHSNSRELLFSGQVQPDGSFNFGGHDRHGTMGTEISIFVDGELNTKIHTSCSRPIYIGMISGDFEILDGSSRNGGQLNTM